MTRKAAGTIVATIVAAGALGTATLPSTAQVQRIVGEPLGPRATFTDDVALKFKVRDHDGKMTVVSTKDPSRTAVVRFTVQPGARFPWHTHAGPVVVNVAEGTLVYVDGDDCGEQAYHAGTAFVDTGHGHVHSAYNPGTTPLVFHATFFEAPPAPHPLTILADAPACA